MQWFYDLELRTKLWLSFAPLGLTALVIGSVGYYGIEQINQQTQRVYATRLVPLVQLSEAEDALAAMQLKVSQLTRTDTGRFRANQRDVGPLRREIESLRADFESRFDAVTDRPRNTKEGRALIDQTEQTWTQLKPKISGILDAAERGALDTARIQTYQTIAHDLGAAFGELKRHERERAKAAEDEADVVYRSAAFALVVAIFVGLGLAGLLAYGVGRILTRPILALDRAAQRVADGDLETRVEVAAADEVGHLAHSFNAMTHQIRSALEDTTAAQERAEKLADRAEHNAARQEAQKERLATNVDLMVEAMDRFSNGDLTVELSAEHSGEIGRLFRGFNEAVANIRATLREVLRSVETAASTATQVSASSDQLAAGAEEQSAQADEVAAAMEEMSRTIVDNAETTTETAKLAAENGQTAKENGEVVLKTVRKMRALGDTVSASTEKVSQLGASSDEIGEIVATIDEIADQTNLLALNAAIEAARAGEHGKGFAVVADEVRQLAERTVKATGEIDEMITAIQQDTSEAVRAMKAGQSEVKEGIQLADRAREAFENIVSSATQVNDRISEIAAATEEQSATSEQISRNIESISTVSQDQAQATNEIARVIDELSDSTVALRTLVDRFTVQEEPSEPVTTSAQSTPNGAKADSKPERQAIADPA